ncbi:hypothetical protein [Guyparkeria halopsychrophila]|uniref:hypothetical protein n=1 Tax=Guyparkeria halopsychrophila TaxID=3139421 RepID=UPI0037CA7E65
MRHMKLSEYRRQAYTPESRPDERTLRRRIDRGELAGKREGSRYYVLVDENGHEAQYLASVKPVNDLAGQVLAKAIEA